VTRRETNLPGSLVTRADPPGPVDLCLPVMSVINVIPDDGETALGRGLRVTNQEVNRVVDPHRGRGDLIDTKRRISGESERSEGSTGSEFCVIEPA